jgi:hypothetical protein
MTRKLPNCDSEDKPSYTCATVLKSSVRDSEFALVSDPTHQIATRNLGVPAESDIDEFLALHRFISTHRGAL